MIGGNTIGQIQLYKTETNIIGEREKIWETVDDITGFLDLSAGESKYTTYNAKIQESTHIFLADYKELDSRIKAENSRMVINGKVYDIMVIDDPMELHKQLEIYLKYTGGQ